MDTDQALRRLFFAGDGKILDVFQSFDWSGHSFGSPENWSPNLLNAFNSMLCTDCPVFIWWGEELILFYNDASIPVLSNLHPQLFAQSISQIFPELAGQLSLLKRGAFNGIPAPEPDLGPLFSSDHSPTEQRQTFRYLPLLNEERKVEGIMAMQGTRPIGTTKDRTAPGQTQKNTQFLIQLDEQLSRASSPKEIEKTVVEALGRYLELERCYFGHIKGENVAVIREFRRSEPSAIATYRLSDYFTAQAVADCRRGIPTVVTDVPTDPRTAASAENHAALQIGAFVTVPILHEQEWVGALNIVSRTPRVWREDELALLRQLSYTTWSRIQRAHAEEALRDSENQLRLITDAMPALISYVDKEHHYRFVNKMYTDWFGYRSEDIIGKHIREVLGESAYQAILPDMVRALAGEKLVFERLLPYKGVGERIVQVHYIPHLRKNGESRGFFALVQDVTERKQVETRIRESEQYFRKLADAAPVLIWQSGLDKGSYYFNKGWFEFTGRTPEQDNGYGWAQLVHPDDIETYLEIYNRSFDQREPFKTEYRLKRYDGVFRWILDHGVPTYDYNGIFTGYIGSCIDVHERKTIEEQKDIFIRIGGHELRTPLTSLLGYLGMAKRTIETIHPANTHVQNAYESALKMRALIQDFLDAYRIQQGEINYEMTEFDFDTLVRKAIENMQSAYPRHTIRLQGQTGAMLKADQARLEQVISNLLSNAIKYSPGKKRVDVSIRRKKSVVQLIVKDYGIGIKKEEIPKIFDRFHRSGNIGKITGMGLGLYLVKRIVDFHRGKVEVESSPGEGSIFMVELPVV